MVILTIVASALAQTPTEVPALPWADVLLGPAGLAAYLLYDNFRLRQANEKLTAVGQETAKTALAALEAVAKSREA